MSHVPRVVPPPHRPRVVPPPKRPRVATPFDGTAKPKPIVQAYYNDLTGQKKEKSKGSFLVSGNGTPQFQGNLGW